MYDMWNTLAQDYSRRAMTKDSDKLSALSGLVHKLGGYYVRPSIWQEFRREILLGVYCRNGHHNIGHYLGVSALSTDQLRL